VQRRGHRGRGRSETHVVGVAPVGTLDVQVRLQTAKVLGLNFRPKQVHVGLGVDPGIGPWRWEPAAGPAARSYTVRTPPFLKVMTSG